MTSTKTKTVTKTPTTKTAEPKKRCRSVEPLVKPPREVQLATFDEGDRGLLVKLLQEPAEFVEHDLFKKASAEKTLFGQKSVLGRGATYFEEVVPIDPAGPGSRDSALTSAQEILLFQRFNYARMRVVKLLVKNKGKRASTQTLRELLGWLHRTMMLRGLIAQANLPLVLAMAKRTRLSGLDYSELISEGNFALLRSVDKFDCARGFKFSTYACRAILKSFSRVAMRTSRYRGHFPTEFDPMLEKSDLVEKRRDKLKSECVDEIREILAKNRADLSEMEQVVIRERFALEADHSQVKPKTLEQVGELIGVTKERVRQIQNKALRKLRLILEENYLAA